MDPKRHNDFLKRHEEYLKMHVEDLEILHNIIKDLERISFYLPELPIPTEAKKSFDIFKKSVLNTNLKLTNRIRYLERDLNENNDKSD